VPRRLSPALLAQLVPAFAALLVFAGALANGFAWDDWPAIVNDGRIHDPSYLLQTLQQPYWPNTGTLWRPLTTLSYLASWAVGGGQPWAFHGVNVALHALASALVARLALRWTPPSAAAAAGLAFAVAPVHVEAVANAVGRAELLCAVGLLTVLLAATRQGPPTVPTLRWISLGAFLALGAKEFGVAAPVLALAANWLVTRTPRHAWRATWWAATPVVLLLTARKLVLGTIAGDAPHPAWWVATGAKGLVLALSAVPQALAMAVLPQPGAWEHSPTLAQAESPSVVMAALGVGIAALGAWGCWRAWKRPSVIALGAVIIMACWLPVSNLLLKTGVFVAERTLYAPSIGLALLVAVAWVRLEAWRPAAAPVALALWAGPAGAITWRDVPQWRDSRAVFEAMVTRNPTSYKAWWYLGQELLWRGDQTGALEAYRQSLAQFDLETKILHAGAQMAVIQRDTAQAIAWLDRSLAIDRHGRRSRTLRVMLAMRQQDKTTALRLLDEGLAMEPDQQMWQAMRRDIARWGEPGASPPTR
jgi:protein O-mannosyl-transferase